VATYRIVLPKPPNNKEWCGTCAIIYQAAMCRRDDVIAEMEAAGPKRVPSGIIDIAPDYLANELGMPLLEAAVTHAPTLMLPNTNGPACWTHIVGKLPQDLIREQQERNGTPGLIRGAEPMRGK